HEAQLGHTIQSIAFEKAGIVKPGIPVVCGRLAPEAEEVVREVCRERGATLVRAEDEVSIARGGAAVTIHSRHHVLEQVPLALAGRHQEESAEVAVSLLGQLADRGFGVPDEAIRAGLSRVAWPARLERFTTADGAEVLVDAAHNPAGTQALASYVRE